MQRKMQRIVPVVSVLSFLGLMQTGIAGQEGSAMQKTRYHASEAGVSATPLAATPRPDGTLVFSAPPRESSQEAQATYGPIAEYLSRVTGKTITFKYTDNWLIYQTEMLKGSYDLVFDGPHFNGWRVAKQQHNTLVRLPGDHMFVVVTRRDEDKVSEVRQLSGRPVCAMASPNLGTLTLLNEFDNPARQPRVTNINGWEKIYQALLTGQCHAAVLPKRNLDKYDPSAQHTKVIFQSKVLPNQALSAGPRISSEDQLKITRALLSAEGMAVTAKLRDTYAVSGGLVSANKDEYVSASSALKDVWGYAH